MKIEEGRLGSFVTLLSFVLVAATLYFAKVVFIPIALAALLTFLLAPLVTRLQRFRLPKPLAIVTTVVLAFGLIGVIAGIVTVQAISLAQQLPQYEQTLRAKMRQIRGAHERPGAFSRAGDLVESLKKDLEPTTAESSPAAAATNAGTATASAEPQPVPVEIKEAKLGPLESMQRMVGPLIGPMGTAAVVAIFVIAMLFQREDLRERFIQLLSGGRLNIATEAVDDAARRISRYLGMQLIVNATYGVPIGIGLYFIGVPNAMLWGLLATLLRFIPYLGPWVAAAFPLALAFAVDPGWSMFLMTLALFVVLELVSNNIIEVWLYGASTGISNVALMVAAVFWTWLWGPVGLFLSTPLTVCLVVMGKYVPGLKFLSVLLGSAPTLQPHERLYQRMLAMDYDQMSAFAKEYFKDHDLIQFYDEVLIPALNAAEEDRHNGSLAEVRQQFILQNTRELIDELGVTTRAQRGLPRTPSDPARVLVVPAKDDMDEVAATILVQLLAFEGVGAKLLSATVLPAECSDVAARERLELICISAVPPSALFAARQLCHKLDERCSGVKTVVGIWSPKAAATDMHDRLSSESPAAVVTTMASALQRIQALLEKPLTEPMTPPPVPLDEAERLQEIEHLHLLDREPDEMFDAVTRELAKAFDVPISLVSVIDADRQFWRAHIGLPADLAAAGEAPRETSVCGHVVASNAPLVVEDISKDKRFANNQFLQSRGIRFYAGAPLRTKAGHAVGSLCVIDTKPRKVTQSEIALLQLLAAQLMDAVNRRVQMSA